MVCYFTILIFRRISANELVASELFKKLTWINTWIDFIVISCVSSLLIYAAYKGLRFIRPYGGVSTYTGLTVVTGCALAASAYTIIYVSYFWPRLLMALLSVFGL